MRSPMSDCHAWIISEASQHIWLAAFSWTTEVNGDWFQNNKKYFHTASLAYYKSPDKRDNTFTWKSIFYNPFKAELFCCHPLRLFSRVLQQFFAPETFCELRNFARHFGFGWTCPLRRRFIREWWFSQAAFLKLIVSEALTAKTLKICWIKWVKQKLSA